LLFEQDQYHLYPMSGWLKIGKAKLA